MAAFVLVDLFTQSSAGERLWTLTLLATIGGVTLLFLTPGAIAFFLDRSDVTRALTNPLEQLDRLAASPLSYVLPSIRHPVLGGIAADLWGPKSRCTRRSSSSASSRSRSRSSVRSSIRRPAGGTRHLLTLAAVTAPIALVASLPRSFELAGIRIRHARVRDGRAHVLLPRVCTLRLRRSASPRRSSPPGPCPGCRAPYAVRPWRLAAIAVVAFDLLVGSVHAYRIDVAPDYDRWLATQPRGIVAHYPMPTDKREARLLAGNEITFQPLTGQPLYTIFGAGTGGTREDGIRILPAISTTP